MPTGAPPTGAPRRRLDAATSAWVLVGLATVASFAGRLVLATWVGGPFIFQDEGGYIGVARALAGDAPALFGPTYHPLWGLLLAPAAAVLGPGDQQTAAQILNALAAALLIPVLHVLGRRVCGLPPLTSAAVAVAGGVTAASFVQATMLVSESLLVLLVATSVVLVHRALTRPGAGPALAAGVAVGCAYGAHPRAVVLLVAVAIAGAVAWRAGLLDGRRLAALGAAALATAVAVQVLHARATEVLYPVGTQPSLAGSPFGAIAEPVGSLVITLGQSWYLVVASLGLTAVGAVAAGRQAWTARGSATGVVGLFVLLGVLGSLALGTSGSYQVGALERLTRADLPVYGRYVEQWFPVLVVLAPTLATRWRRTTAAASALAVVAVAALLRARYPQETWDLPVAWHNIASLRLPVDVFGTDHLLATGVAAGLLTSALLLPRRAGDVRWLVPLGALVAVNLLAGFAVVRDWAAPSAERWVERQAIAPALVAAGEPVWVDRRDHHDISWAYHAQFWHPDLEVHYFDGTPPPEATHLLARADDAPAPGASPALAEPHGDFMLWTRPAP